MPRIRIKQDDQKQRKSIYICPACRDYTEFGIIVVIPKKILYRKRIENPCRIRKVGSIIRYNIFLIQKNARMKE